MVSCTLFRCIGSERIAQWARRASRGADAVKAPLFDFLGLNGADTLAEYLESLERHLQSLSGQLIGIQQGIQQILAGIAAVQEEVIDVGVQEALRHFNDNANVIRENFRTYNDGVAALGSRDAVGRRDGAQTLFDLFGVINAQNIALAMTNVEDAFLPPLLEMKGLLDYQHRVVAAATTGPSSDDARYFIGAMGGLPTVGGVWECSRIIDYSHAAAYDALGAAVADTFKAFITVASQGLILLNAAWRHSIHERRVDNHVDRITAALAAMRGFPAAVGASIDAHVAANLHTYGKYLMPRAASNDIRWDFGYGIVQMQYPLSNEWIMWRRDSPYPAETRLLMVERPWEFGSCRTALIEYDPPQDHIYCFFSDGPPKPDVQTGGPARENIVRYLRPTPPGLEFVERL